MLTVNVLTVVNVVTVNMLTVNVVTVKVVTVNVVTVNRISHGGGHKVPAAFSTVQNFLTKLYLNVKFCDFS